MTADTSHPETIELRRASQAELPLVAAILGEAQAWLESIGQPLWLPEHLSLEAVRAGERAGGQSYLAWRGAEPVGTVRVQPEDPEFWPEMQHGEAIYLHRLAVRRSVAGRGAAEAILEWAKAYTRAEGRAWLRLDCVSDRPRLRALYERCGFALHDERQVGLYHVTRYAYAVGQSGSGAGATPNP